jgi:hypothetical protein
MALPAFRPFLSSMFVVFLMTGITVHRGVFVAIIRVAVFAGHLDMLVPKFVSGFVVIEPDVLPILLRVAVGAGGSHPAFMFIVLFVAAITVGWGVTIFGRGFMAGLALDFLCIGMGAFERKVRPFMVEGLFGNWGDIFGSAFVFGMAFFAFPRLLESSVVPLFLIDILAGLFMAIEAEGRLGCLVEPLVAHGTALFPFGMALNDLPRHQCGFDILGPGWWSHEYPKTEEKEGNTVVSHQESGHHLIGLNTYRPR